MINKACNFTIQILTFVVFMEGVDHVYVLKLPGSPLQRMSYAFFFLIHALIIKYLVNRFEFLENYAPFMISASCMIYLTERGIYLSPDSFKLSHM
jgi:hypothetical protein